MLEVSAAPKHGRLYEFNTAKEAKLVAGTNKHTLNVDGEHFLRVTVKKTKLL